MDVESLMNVAIMRVKEQYELQTFGCCCSTLFSSTIERWLLPVRETSSVVVLFSHHDVVKMTPSPSSRQTLWPHKPFRQRILQTLVELMRCLANHMLNPKRYYNTILSSKEKNTLNIETCSYITSAMALILRVTSLLRRTRFS